MRVQYLKETGDPTAAAAAQSLKQNTKDRAAQAVKDEANQKMFDEAKAARRQSKVDAHSQSIKAAHAKKAAKARVFGGGDGDGPAGPVPGTPKGK